MKNASKALDCIGCMCCYSACPVIGLGDLTDFAGPAPLVQLGQTALDPRNDPAKVARSLSLTGIFNCVSCYKCEEVCPASIPIVSQVIEPLKAKAAALVPGDGEAFQRAARRRRRARLCRSERAGAARARARRAARSAARVAAARARQDRSDQDAAADAGRRRAPPPRGCLGQGSGDRREICLLSRLLGPLDLRRAQRGDAPGRRRPRPRARAAQFRDLHRRARAARHRSASASTPSTCAFSRSPSARACR